MSQSSLGRGVTGKAENRNKGRAYGDPFSNTFSCQECWVLTVGWEATGLAGPVVCFV